MYYLDCGGIMLEKTGFGYIIVDGKRYNHDIVIHVDGQISKRKKELSKPFKRGLHTPLAPPEVEELLDEGPEVIVIGSGQFGALPIIDEAVQIVKDRGVEIIIDTTPRVIEVINKLRNEGKRVAAILHVTC